MADLEEITTDELNRIGGLLEEEYDVFKNLYDENKSDKELDNYIKIYFNKLKEFNKMVRLAESYRGDHIIKYYKDVKTKELSYKIIKRKPTGFL